MMSMRDIFKSSISFTDKNVGIRNHVGLYEVLFEEYRDRVEKLVEIGVSGGGSIEAWHKYFPQAEIYGLDIKDIALETISSIEGVTPIKLDQADPYQLQAFANDEGPFDIVIDDGSHVWSHQILSFEALWSHVSPGGVYVVEDIITSYPDWLERSKASGGLATRRFYDRGPISTVDYFKNLIDEINCHGALICSKNDATLSIESFTEIQRTVDWISFRNNSIFIRRRTVDSDV